MKYTTLLIFSFLWTAAVNGQKKNLAEEDHSLWHLLSTGTISPDGHWYYYTLHYRSKDSVFVKGLHDNRSYTIPNSQYGNFSGDSRWFAAQSVDSLILLDLQKSKKSALHDVEAFQFTDNGKLLVLQPDGAYKKLSVVTEGQREQIFDSINCYNISKTNFTAFSRRINNQYTINVLDNLGVLQNTVTLPNTEGAIKKIVWDEHNTSILVYTKGSGSTDSGQLFFIKKDTL
ncbi:MAG: hypothetical protein EOO88_50985, partial [Pedobacter sp.]